MGEIARILAVAVIGGALATGCGGGDEKQAAADPSSKAKPARETGDKAGSPAVSTVKPANPGEAQLATAVADSKTTAPIDLLYDLPAKPELGQAFNVELAFKPRLPADSLDVEIGDSPGITIDGDRVTRFLNVDAGQLYKFTVRAHGDTAGLYYIAVIAKLGTKVQSEGRAFSVPVVIGNPPAAQKSEPTKDASGQAVESMPAKEG